jgi:hypothetical protein
MLEAAPRSPRRAAGDEVGRRTTPRSWPRTSPGRPTRPARPRSPRRSARSSAGPTRWCRRVPATDMFHPKTCDHRSPMAGEQYR